jgi:hypothetical protein
MVFKPGRLAIGGGALVAGFALGTILLSYGPEAYGSWREGRLLKRASAMLAQQDLDGAMQAAREVVQRRPNSLAAYHILA